MREQVREPVSLGRKAGLLFDVVEAGVAMIVLLTGKTAMVHAER